MSDCQRHCSLGYPSSVSANDNVNLFGTVSAIDGSQTSVVRNKLLSKLIEFSCFKVKMFSNIFKMARQYIL